MAAPPHPLPARPPGDLPRFDFLGPRRRLLLCFWSDHWIDGCSIAEIASLIHTMALSHRHKACSVSESLLQYAWIRDIKGAVGPMALVQYVELWHRLSHVVLSDMPDTLTWCLSANGL